MSPDRKTRPDFESEVSPMSSDTCHRCLRTKLLPMFPLAHSGLRSACAKASRCIGRASPSRNARTREPVVPRRRTSAWPASRASRGQKTRQATSRNNRHRSTRRRLQHRDRFDHSIDDRHQRSTNDRHRGSTCQHRRPATCVRERADATARYAAARPERRTAIVVDVEAVPACSPQATSADVLIRARASQSPRVTPWPPACSIALPRLHTRLLSRPFTTTPTLFPTMKRSLRGPAGWRGDAPSERCAHGQ